MSVNLLWYASYTVRDVSILLQVSSASAVSVEYLWTRRKFLRLDNLSEGGNGSKILLSTWDLRWTTNETASLYLASVKRMACWTRIGSSTSRGNVCKSHASIKLILFFPNKTGWFPSLLSLYYLENLVKRCPHSASCELQLPDLFFTGNLRESH
jgi:hypothetical protein